MDDARTTGHPRGLWRALVAGVVVNGLTLVGVIVLGWPAGNVFLLFWIENAILGIVTIPKVATARGPEKSGKDTGRSGGITTALFFCFHYGLFCVVHLVFTALVAWSVGVDLSLFALGLPAALIALRYLAETLLTWFGDRNRRLRVSPSQAMGEPYPRLIVLHLSVIIGFALFVVGRGLPADLLAGLRGVLDPIVGAGTISDEVVAVAVLLVIKTVADVHFTRRAVGSDPSRPQRTSSTAGPAAAVG